MRWKIYPHDRGLLVHDAANDARVLMGISVVILAPDMLVTKARASCGSTMTCAVRNAGRVEPDQSSRPPVPWAMAPSIPAGDSTANSDCPSRDAYTLCATPG